MSKSLTERYDDLVNKLRLLSEASSRSVVPFSAHGKPGSKAPAGAEGDRPQDAHGGPYDPDRDPLILWFLWKWNKATSDHQRLAAVAEGELRLNRRQKRPPARTAGAFGMGSHESEEERDRRIAEDYVGLLPVEVRIVESEVYGFCSEQNIRKVRIRHKRDPENGEPRPGSDEDEKYALELRRLGMSIGTIALRLGRPKSTVATWLKKANGTDKAA